MLASMLASMELQKKMNATRIVAVIFSQRQELHRFDHIHG